jgi:5-methylcytosine-specific restriction endonuclease McrA
MSVSDTDISPKTWQAVVESFGGRCAYCLCHGAPLAIDHVEPIANGGRHVLDNIVPACESCNSSKGRHGLLQILLHRGLLVTRGMLAPVF